jgi:protein-L-isoaspartate(D-aspartate) O-methyltransferase
MTTRPASEDQGVGVRRQERRLERRHMIRRHLWTRGLRDRRVLAAMAWVPRERFLAPGQGARAYDDAPLPTTHGQTISQPYIVALMTAEAGVTRRSRVLEIGTGTGYHTAILAKLARSVWTLDRLPELSRDAARHLAELGITNVVLLVGDGAQGYAPAAPYHAIVVSAAAPAVPPRLLNQLDLGGRLVIPVGDIGLQELMVYRRTPAGFDSHSAGPCRFVPLLSPAAFDEH